MIDELIIDVVIAISIHWIIIDALVQ